MSQPREPEERVKLWRVFLVSIVIWTFLALYYAVLSYKWRRDNGYPTAFVNAVIFPAVESAIAAALTPLVYWLARKYPVEAGNWRQRVPLHIMGLVAYAFVHAVLRVALYPPRAPSGKPMARTLWTVWQLFLSNTYDDGTATYGPTLAIAQMVGFYGKFRNKELRAAQLEIEHAQTQLQTLKTQLQPHFLFNTLHSISAQMHFNVDAADKMMTQLCDLLRLSLNTADVQVCSLKRELEFLDLYLQIEQTRFSDKLWVSMQIDPETLDARVPHMILQPLAENALRHGVSKLTNGGRITVKARRENDCLQLSIQDNGPGFDFPWPGNCGNAGFGLTTTQRRLERLYGQSFSFIVQRLTEGVEVGIALPFVLCDAEMLDTDSFLR